MRLMGVGCHARCGDRLGQRHLAGGTFHRTLARRCQDGLLRLSRKDRSPSRDRALDIAWLGRTDRDDLTVLHHHPATGKRPITLQHRPTESGWLLRRSRWARTGCHRRRGEGTGPGGPGHQRCSRDRRPRGQDRHPGGGTPRRPDDRAEAHRRPYENVVFAYPSWVDMVMIGGDIIYGRADWVAELSTPRRLRPGHRLLLDTRFGSRTGVATSAGCGSIGRHVPLITKPSVLPRPRRPHRLPCSRKGRS